MASTAQEELPRVFGEQRAFDGEIATRAMTCGAQPNQR